MAADILIEATFHQFFCRSQVQFSRLFAPLLSAAWPEIARSQGTFPTDTKGWQSEQAQHKRQQNNRSGLCSANFVHSSQNEDCLLLRQNLFHIEGMPRGQKSNYVFYQMFSFRLDVSLNADKSCQAGSNKATCPARTPFTALAITTH